MYDLLTGLCGSSAVDTGAAVSCESGSLIVTVAPSLDGDPQRRGLGGFGFRHSNSNHVGYISRTVTDLVTIGKTPIDFGRLAGA
jgi:hypothetical protein